MVQSHQSVQVILLCFNRIDSGYCHVYYNQGNRGIDSTPCHNDSEFYFFVSGSSKDDRLRLNGNQLQEKDWLALNIAGGEM